MAMLEYPLATEKAIGLIEKNNQITYIVRHDATKSELKKEFERMFNVKVASVNISNTMENRKKASIKLKKEFKASDVAIKLKLV
jgi:large subunit ribosomal protein L23